MIPLQEFFHADRAGENGIAALDPGDEVIKSIILIQSAMAAV